jgi:hypothetical protein
VRRRRGVGAIIDVDHLEAGHPGASDVAPTPGAQPVGEEAARVSSINAISGGAPTRIGGPQ